MVKWFCSLSLCYNNFRSKTSNGETSKFNRLSKDTKIQSEYKKILKTEGINWKSGHICCEHWSAGMKTDINHLPDITVPSSQIQIIENKYIKAKERYGKVKLPTNTNKI